MKRLSKRKFFLILFIVITIMFTQVHASIDASLQSKNAASIVTLKILQGYPDGSLKLQNNIKRSEFAAMIVRMMGYDKETDANDVPMNYKDITKSHWAYNYIRLSLKHKIIGGYPGNTIGPDKNITYSEALTMLVRAMGYEKSLVGTWPDNVINKSAQLGITKDISLPKDKQLTRGEISVLIYNSLTVPFSN